MNVPNCMHKTMHGASARVKLNETFSIPIRVENYVTAQRTPCPGSILSEFDMAKLAVLQATFLIICTFLCENIETLPIKWIRFDVAFIFF